MESLEARRAVGRPPLALSFVNCDITEDQLVALEQSTATDTVFCYPRVSKEMMELAEKFGINLPPAHMLPPTFTTGAIIS